LPASVVFLPYLLIYFLSFLKGEPTLINLSAYIPNMRILAPFTRVSEVTPLISCGADELYCGLMPSAFKAQFSNMGSLNCYGSSRANLSSLDDLKQAVDVASS
jgi:hypothetical protein